MENVDEVGGTGGKRYLGVLGIGEEVGNILGGGLKGLFEGAVVGLDEIGIAVEEGFVVLD